MLRYVLPIVICAAVGALVVVLVKMGDDTTEPARPEQQADTDGVVATPNGSAMRPHVSDSEDLHEGLAELERVLDREDLSRAGYFRQKVCEDMDAILEDRTLTKNLLAAIRKYGVESDDMKRRDIVLPMLRVVRHPEATQMIEEEFYRARSEAERMMFLEAMSHDYHDPKRAAEWAVERALNANDAEHRRRALEVIEYFSNDDELVVDTALQVYASTTHREQARQAIDAITKRSAEVKAAQDWVRRKLKNPRSNEIGQIVTHIPAWGNERDAAQLETLAEEFPAMGDHFRDVARQIREGKRIQEDKAREMSGKPPTLAEREAIESARAERERADRERRKKEGGAKPDDDQ